MPREGSDLLHGTLDIVILKALSGRSMHGVAVAAWVEKRSAPTFTIVDAALYKALHRLEAIGAVRSEWGKSASNRRARYYSITPSGQRRLRTGTGVWRRYAKAVTAILDDP